MLPRLLTEDKTHCKNTGCNISERSLAQSVKSFSSLSTISCSPSWALCCWADKEKAWPFFEDWEKLDCLRVWADLLSWALLFGSHASEFPLKYFGDSFSNNWVLLLPSVCVCVMGFDDGAPRWTRPISNYSLGGITKLLCGCDREWVCVCLIKWESWE